MSKRSISSFFNKVPSKKPRLSDTQEGGDISLPPPSPSTHPSYPHPIASLPTTLLTALDTYDRPAFKAITKTDLTIDFYQPFFSTASSKQLYLFLRQSLPFYRVTYNIKRGDFETTINTPRFTTVFGIDSHSYFSDDEARTILDSKTHKPVPADRYKLCACRPRPIPGSLEVLKNIVERESGETFNFVLVNYYASSADSISYHSDDEKFLGPNPTIASMSLGTTRDFLMKHKDDKNLTLKLALNNGELLVMKGSTQSKWLHSIPKRASNIGGWASGGRINITFRKGVQMACTGNYYRYNVGVGKVHRWNAGKEEMEEYEGDIVKNDESAGKAPESDAQTSLKAEKKHEQQEKENGKQKDEEDIKK